MANKNTLRRRRLNPAHTGESAMISQNLERNMELVVVGGKTVYRPIDADLASWPKQHKWSNGHRRGAEKRGQKAEPASTPRNIVPALLVRAESENERLLAA